LTCYALDVRAFMLGDGSCAYCRLTTSNRRDLFECLRRKRAIADSQVAMPAMAFAMTPPTSPTRVRVPTKSPPVALAHARYHYVNTSIPRFVKIQPGNGVCHGQAAILAVHWQARKAACQTATGTLAASLCAHPSLRARAANSTKTTTLKGRAAMSFHLMSAPAGPFITCVTVQVGMGVPASHWRLYRSLCWHRAFN